MLRRLVRHFIGAFFAWGIAISCAQVTPSDRARELYEPMDRVLRRYSSLAEFLRSPTGVRDYIAAFRGSQLGRSWRHRDWVDLNINQIADQLRAMLPHIPQAALDMLWNARSPLHREVSGIAAADPVVDWSETGLGDWTERYRRVREGFRAPQTHWAVTAAVTAEYLRARTEVSTRRWDDNHTLLVEGAVLRQLRALLSQEYWDVALGSEDSPGLVRQSLNRLRDSWIQRVIEQLQRIDTALPNREAQLLAFSLVGEASRMIRWPTSQEVNEWLPRRSNGRTHWYVAESPRSIHEVMVGGVLPRECTSGGLERHLNSIHPHDYLLSALGGRTAIVLRGETAERATFEGTLLFVPFASTATYGVRSRLHLEEMRSLRRLVSESMTLFGIERIAIEGSAEAHLDNSGVFQLLRTEMPEADIVVGHYDPLGSWLNEAVRHSGASSTPTAGAALVQRPIVPGIAATEDFTIQIDRSALENPTEVNRPHRIGVWMARLAAQIEQDAIGEYAGLAERLGEIAPVAPAEIPHVFRILNRIAASENRLGVRAAAVQSMAHIGLFDPDQARASVAALFDFLDTVQNPPAIQPATTALKQLADRSAAIRFEIVLGLANRLIGNSSDLLKLHFCEMIYHIVDLSDGSLRTRLTGEQTIVLFLKDYQDRILTGNAPPEYFLMRYSNRLYRAAFAETHEFDLQALIRLPSALWQRAVAILDSTNPSAPIREGYRHQLAEIQAEPERHPAAECALIQVRISTVRTALGI